MSSSDREDFENARYARSVKAIRDAMAEDGVTLKAIEQIRREMATGKPRKPRVWFRILGRPVWWPWR